MGQISTTPEEAIETARRSGDVYPPTDCDAPSTIKITDLSSKLSKEELIDRIKGTIYGKLYHILSLKKTIINFFQEIV